MAGVVHLVAFAVYNRQLLRGESRPNAATWTIWAFVATLNCLTYFFAGQDWVKAILPVLGSLACIATLVYALVRGTLSPLAGVDLAALAIGVAAVLVWWFYRSASFANLVLQLAFLVSFLPTYRDVWRDPSKERPLPWFLWASAYLLLVMAVFLRWQGLITDLVYPLLALVIHAAVGFLAQRRVAPRPINE
jgi:hypothetical protein